MHCDILSRHEVGITWLAEALLLDAQTFAAHPCQACSLSCAAAEDKDYYPESKKVGLELVFLTLTCCMLLVHLIPPPRGAEPLNSCILNAWHGFSIQNWQ